MTAHTREMSQNFGQYPKINVGFFSYLKINIVRISLAHPYAIEKLYNSFRSYVGEVEHLED